MKPAVGDHGGRFFRYCIAGGTGAGIDFVLFTVLVKVLQVNYLASTIVSFSVALILVYLLQRDWTFRGQVATGAPFQRYLISVALMYAFNSSLLVTLIELFMFGVIPAKMLQVIAGTVPGYILTRYFVFTRDERTRPGAALQS